MNIRKLPMWGGMLLVFVFSTWDQQVLTAPPASPAGAVYYVAINGDDNDPGALDRPFRTIQRCATVAVAGDTCLIRSGTYRETVTVAHSGAEGNPLTFAPYSGETVTVSGADVISGWTLHTHPSGHVYRASMPWSLNVCSGDPAQVTDNQRFVASNLLDPVVALIEEPPHGFQDWLLSDTRVSMLTAPHEQRFIRGSRRVVCDQLQADWLS